MLLTQRKGDEKIITIKICIFIIFFQLNCFGQTFSDIISDFEITSFLKWEIKNSKKYNEESAISFRRRIDPSIFKWQTQHFEIDDESKYSSFEYLFSDENGLDTIFEREFFIKQSKAINTETWSKKIRRAKFIDDKGKYYYKYSIPLFSKDKSFVILKKEFFCGDICAYGGIYLYKKINNNKWEKIQVIKNWVS